MELLRDSHKYELSGLKTICEKYLTESLTTENAIEIVKAAEMYEAEVLIGITVKYIALHFNEVFGEKNQPSDLSNNLLMRIFNKK